VNLFCDGVLGHCSGAWSGMPLFQFSALKLSCEFMVCWAAFVEKKNIDYANVSKSFPYGVMD